MQNQANRYYSGNYQEVAIVPVEEEKKHRKKKSTKQHKTEYLTRPAQQLVNDRNTFRWMRVALQGNFGKGDYFLTLTFKSGDLPPPKDIKKAKYFLSDVFLRGCRRKYQKLGQPFKYIWVLEYELDENGDYLKRAHFHIIINSVSGISRDEIEDCWARGRKNARKSLGRVHAKRLIPTEEGLLDLAKYLSKGQRWKKSAKIWNCSNNLERPKKQKRKKIFSFRQMEKMAMSNDLGYDLIASKYPNHHIQEISFKHNEFKGWHLYIKMWRKSRDG